ncbi:hypothetical protein GCM10010156_48960 [Planobispora rosea]|uniref:RapZ C-terminal domain-containing protein n=1 Tax=Planobispora rosea TaxID=35762 RepID=A0A8J3S2C4_PLARO|nr:RNase adapter RapZ [Planobispora rosea]GGS84545.1 hypothetical protein GCM10010156_48960 [Planobispora rosea]GIH86407.1 hypothetical protein Pro02_48150 [Planobispora rosea]
MTIPAPALRTAPSVEITSFGYGHAPAPTADIVIDARRRFRNPHHDPRMRELTGLNDRVHGHVMTTPGVAAAVAHTAQLAAELTTTTGAPVTVAIGCAGGRHRSVAMAEDLADELDGAGVHVTVTHRDVAKPVLPAAAAAHAPEDPQAPADRRPEARTKGPLSGRRLLMARLAIIDAVAVTVALPLLAERLMAMFALPLLVALAAYTVVLAAAGTVAWRGWRGRSTPLPVRLVVDAAAALALAAIVTAFLTT